MDSNAKVVSVKERLRSKKSEVNRLVCDNKKLKKLIKFKPKIILDTGLKNTVNWFMNPQNRKYYKSDIYNI